MKDFLKILFVSAECAPYAKTGGLGDVMASLPVYLNKLGHDSIIVIPGYSFIDRSVFRIDIAIKNMNVRMGYENIICNVNKTLLDDNVTVYMIDYDPFFGRPNIYHDDNFNDYPDNPKRFAFLAKAALQLCHELQFKPDIVHAHDWHTAILSAYLKRTYKDDPIFSETASILTIHNLAYQGMYDRSNYDYTGLWREDFTPDKFECYNAVNFLKGGIFFADIVNTVSPGYALETKTSMGGFGLDAFLNAKGDNYMGILNGADYHSWDPAKDPLIPANFTAGNLSGKSVCKTVLQERFGLDQSKSKPIIGIVSRLVEQKGFYILNECIDAIINNMDVQFAILGSGDNRLESFYGNLGQRYPGKTGSFIGYDNQLAHLIEAGSDFFLMPSLFEPCGLNQIYSLKYGTLPVVRATGGLRDTVDNYDQATGKGTGFVFYEASGKAIYNTVGWALETYYNRKNHMERLIKRAMKQDFSWDKSAEEYVRLYLKALKTKLYERN